ncbi:MAG: hypothetical protein JNK95_06895 [Candidatus Competibacter sp.]|nr:hypothetical protein [Candidatus Competibacter sp.]MDG4604766.1 hypothetical protein [Candidatus Contendobacter sp.]HRD49470.1 hypothetical protein [Candidatus Contendobacter sp.]
MTTSVEDSVPPLSEADTHAKLIEPLLRARGQVDCTLAHCFGKILALIDRLR